MLVLRQGHFASLLARHADRGAQAWGLWDLRRSRQGSLVQVPVVHVAPEMGPGARILDGHLDEKELMREELRRCPRCMGITRFAGMRCGACGYRGEDPGEMPAVYSERCLRCQRIVAATIDGLCGICAARAEYDVRKRAGTLSRTDRVEYIRIAGKRKIARL